MKVNLAESTEFNYFPNGRLIGFKDTIGILFLAILIHVQLKLSDAYYFFVK